MAIIMDFRSTILRSRGRPHKWSWYCTSLGRSWSRNTAAGVFVKEQIIITVMITIITIIIIIFILFPSTQSAMVRNGLFLLSETISSHSVTWQLYHKVRQNRRQVIVYVFDSHAQRQATGCFRIH